MMRLAARAHDLGIVDRHHRLPIADERVADACKAAPESRELHVLLLQGPVREKLRHWRRGAKINWRPAADRRAR